MKKPVKKPVKKRTFISPPSRSSITNEVLDGAIAALVAGEPATVVAARLGISTVTLWKLRTGRTKYLADGVNSRRAA